VDTQGNALMEAFTARFRQVCLNEQLFPSVADAQERVDAWREDYKGETPGFSGATARFGGERYAAGVRPAGTPCPPHQNGQGINGTARTTQRQRQEALGA